MTPATDRIAFRVSALLGLLGVALGAFGAHALQEVLARSAATHLWETAVFYHLLHAVVMLIVAGLRPLPRAAWGFLGLGVLAFSGSLYVYAVTQIHWLVFVTPLGGVFFLVGWLLLMLRPVAAISDSPNPS